MIHVVWEFRVKQRGLQMFEREYASTGSWGELFGRSSSYRGTQLLRDQGDPLRFLTVDAWDSISSYDNFRADHMMEYRELDQKFEQLTNSETCLGIFEVI